MLLRGDDVYFSGPAKHGDADYAKFWEIVQNKREETVFNSVEEGVKAMRDGKNVIHISEGMLKRYFFERPYIQQPVKVFAKEKPEFKAIIVTLNSPLKPIFEFGIRSLMQEKTSDRVLRKWEGPSLVDIPDDPMVLNLRHVILAFIVPGLIASFSIIVFLFECTWKRQR